MAKKNGIYKCNMCGNVVEVVNDGGVEMQCCGQDMVLQEENTVEAAFEKHIPIVEFDGNKVLVRVGEVDHPMTEDHYIQLIEVLGDNKVIASSWLNPNDEPVAEFHLSSTQGVTARAYCNLHGLWKSQ